MASPNATARTPRVTAPTALRITNDRTGVYLTWRSGAATGFAITQGMDAALKHNRRTYTVRGTATQFTPYGLTRGRTYWFRVRALSGTSSSARSAEVSVKLATREQPVRVMSYNILTKDADGTMSSGGGRIAPWNTQRKAAAARLIEAGNPDVISIQEGWAWVGAARGPRQVDSLRSALGPGYSLASTETPPNQPYYFRSGNYIIYRNSRYRTVGHGWFWRLNGDPHYAAYQVLQNKSSGAMFLFVAPHLVVGAGSAFDLQRQAETASLVSLARAYAHQMGGVPIIYAGDFNSYLSHTHTFDGPGRVMRSAHVADGLLAAQSLANQRYNSANRYMRTPPAVGYSLDHIYAGPGVAVGGWRELVDVTRGRLVGVIPSDHNPVVADLSVRY